MGQDEPTNPNKRHDMTTNDPYTGAPQVREHPTCICIPMEAIYGTNGDPELYGPVLDLWRDAVQDGLWERPISEHGLRVKYGLRFGMARMLYHGLIRHGAIVQIGDLEAPASRRQFRLKRAE